jgi:hypothetical protein
MAGCKVTERKQDLTAAEAVVIADASFTREFPGDRRAIRRPFASDQNKYWLVEYDLPPGYAGGTPTFIIDKRSREIITTFSDQ